MEIEVLGCPEHARFTAGVKYPVYGAGRGLLSAFVFDNEGESFFLSELEYKNAG